MDSHIVDLLSGAAPRLVSFLCHVTVVIAGNVAIDVRVVGMPWYLAPNLTSLLLSSRLSLCSPKNYLMSSNSM